MIEQVVISENGGQEGKWIALLCGLIVLSGVLLLPYNQAQYKRASVASHQVSIKSLTMQPLAMIADLRLAHEEIRHIYQDAQTWEPVAQLEAQWVAPFVKDKSWDHQGKHQWALVAGGLYQGIPVQEGARFILNSQHQHVDIWLDLDGSARLFDAWLNRSELVLIQPQQLIEAGWVQVVFEPDSDSDPLSHTDSHL